MSWGVVATAAGTGLSAYLTYSTAQKNRQQAREDAKKAREERKIKQDALDVAKQKYKDRKIENPFADMENVFEDLTVNQQAAQFQTEQIAQQQANIMQQMRSVAGASGIAGLAQTLANQGALQTQRAAASIGQQEAANRMAAAKGAGQIQTLERQGAQWQQQTEMDREATMLGMDFAAATGANKAYQQAMTNKMNARIAQQQAMLEGLGSLTTIGATMFEDDVFTEVGGELKKAGSWLSGQFGGGGNPVESDRRLKKNINKIGESPSGLNIYSFEYIDSKYGKGLFQGVMSDEIPQEAVINNGEYDMVNYNMLDVEFKQI